MLDIDTKRYRLEEAIYEFYVTGATTCDAHEVVERIAQDYLDDEMIANGENR